MSIKGITFDNQAVSAKDHGALFRAVCTDGIVDGCTVTASGSTLTIAAGYFVAAGRLMRLVAAEPVPIVGTSGYARVLAKIDLSGEATTTAFTQASFTVQYADAQSGFPALTQDDVNTSGSVYESIVCVLALGTGGISSIVSQWSNALPTGVAAHTSNRSNPHGVTAAQTGAATDTALTAHTGNTNNPHGVTAAQVGATPAAHASNTSNPHGVTAAQVGAKAAGAVEDIAHGGTGATTPQAALQSLGVATLFRTTEARSSGYYKIAINDYQDWMLTFTVRVYQSYTWYDIVVSGYNYTPTTNWYASAAKLYSCKDSLNIKLGHDANSHLWLAIPAESYTGIAILNCCSGFRYADNFAGLFTVTYEASLSGTIQFDWTLYRERHLEDTILIPGQYGTTLPGSAVPGTLFYKKA